MNETPTKAITPGRKAAALVAQVINAEPEAPTGRPLFCIGWDGRSQPMFRYADEMALPDHERAIVSEADMAVQAEASRRAAERGRMVERSRRLNEAARAGELAEKRKVMGY